MSRVYVAICRKSQPMPPEINHQIDFRDLLRRQVGGLFALENTPGIDARLVVKIDVEVVNAIRRAIATIPDAILLCASSPHARKGALWDAHRRHYAQDGDPIWFGKRRHG